MSSRSKSRARVVCGVALTATLLWVGCGDEAASGADVCTEEFAGDECTVFEMVNQERAQAGKPPLRFDVTLARAARGHATDMIARNYFAHDSPEGTTFSERAKASGYTGFPRGENIGTGYFTPQEAMLAWMNSPGHRNNILDSEATAMGVGMDGVHWVQVFGIDEE